MPHPLYLYNMNNIFHPTDFSFNPDTAFVHALKLAWTTSSRLTLFHVNESLDELSWQEFPSIRATLAKWGVHHEEISTLLTPISKIDVEKILYRGKDPSSSILKHLDRHPSDLIVLATHQLGGKPFFPSIAEPVARKSRVMTLFIPQSAKGFVSPEDGTLSLKNVIVPIDHEPQPRAAFQAITTLADVLGCKQVSVTLLYVGDEEEMPDYSPPQHNTCVWEHIVRFGDVVNEILQTEQDLRADLIVMPTQGHHGILDALRGSTTERVVRGAQCPVLAVPTK